LLLVGRETRPLPDAIAFTSQPFIEGLTWNRDACLAMLTNAKIQLKDGARWRVPADLTQDEKQSIIESISKFTQGENATQIMEELIGYTYTFPREEKRSFLRDGREFSTMLNSCGRINKSGVGISICMGDRNTMLEEGKKILSEYRGMIREYMNVLSNERWRTNNMENCVMVNAQGLVPETMTGTISSLIAGSPKNSGKIVILRTDGSEGTIKFSSRKSASCKNSINLSQLMRGGAEQFNGIGGGHEAAAGAKITKDKLDGFLDYLESNVTKMPDRDSNQ
jgi:RecJ-like exonuclease